MSDVEIVGLAEHDEDEQTKNRLRALVAGVEAKGDKVRLVTRWHRMSESLLYNRRSTWKAAAVA